MLYLLLIIFLNTLLTVIFKLFPRYKIDTLQAIVVNYWVCVITGSIFLGRFPLSVEHMQQPWLPWALLAGAGFIIVFNLMGYCTRVDGITTATIANKLSLVIPVIFSVILYHEATGWMKILGIIIAFPAVYLTTRVPGEKAKGQNLLWPALLFIGSGMLDTLVKYVEQRHLDTPEVQAMFTITVFGTAACIGTVLILFLLLSGKLKFNGRNIIAGICLGIPNYFSIYFLIVLLHSGLLSSSAAIPVLNIGVMLASAGVAIVLFKEKTTPARIAGLVLALAAILLITFADLHGHGI